MTLDEGDELLYVRLTDGETNMIIASHKGNAVRFEENQVRSMGRGARGVRAMSLDDDDYIVGVAIVDEEKSLLTVTENGLAKRTAFSDFRLMKHRGGKGIIAHNINDKTGLLCSIATVAEDDDVMLITNEGTIIRTPVSGINLYSRTASGVIIMRLDDGAKIYNFARIEKNEEIEEESAREEEALQSAPVPELDEEAEDGVSETAEQVENNDADTDEENRE